MRNPTNERSVGTLREIVGDHRARFAKLFSTFSKGDPAGGNSQVHCRFSRIPARPSLKGHSVGILCKAGDFSVMSRSHGVVTKPEPLGLRAPQPRRFGFVTTPNLRGWCVRNPGGSGLAAVHGAHKHSALTQSFCTIPDISGIIRNCSV